MGTTTVERSFSFSEGVAYEVMRRSSKVVGKERGRLYICMSGVNRNMSSTDSVCTTTFIYRQCVHHYIHLQTVCVPLHSSTDHIGINLVLSTLKLGHTRRQVLALISFMPSFGYSINYGRVLILSQGSTVE